jgi:hypothetical protein
VSRSGAPTRARARVIDPHTDAGWRAFAYAHPAAVVFHQPAWTAALTGVFGYAPRFSVLEDDEGNIVAAWPAMLVKSRLTGSRLVSLPFCHHAGPIVDTREQAETLLEVVIEDAHRLGAGRLEARAWPCGVEAPERLQRVDYYVRHIIDLSKGPDAVMRSFDRDVRYSIRRAQREGVTVRLGTGREDLETFWRLHIDLRRRQGLLPQPYAFIKAIYRSFIETGEGFMVIAERAERPIAALLSLTHRETAVGTHAASDLEARRCRATHLAMWRSIEVACARGLKAYDLGRSLPHAAGLHHFKSEWGAVPEGLPYYYYPTPSGVNVGDISGFKRGLLGAFTRRVPDAVLAAVGSLVYPHIG